MQSIENTPTNNKNRQVIIYQEPMTINQNTMHKEEGNNLQHLYSSIDYQREGEGDELRDACTIQ